MKNHKQKIITTILTILLTVSLTSLILANSPGVRVKVPKYAEKVY